MHRILIAALVSLPLAAHAALGPMPGEEQFNSMMPDQKQSFGAELGAGKIGEDWFMKLTLGTELNLGSVGVGLQIPLNLRVWDKDPKNDNDYYGLIRHEDWDQPGDYVRVIRYARLGHKRDKFYLRAGEIAGTVGHGTIMSRYVNTGLDVADRRVGTELDINTNYGGFETVISDLGTLYDTSKPDSRILGFRGHVKPYALVDPESSLNIFAIGVTVISDVNAPRVAAATADPARPDILSTTAATVYGFDAEVEVMHNALLDLVPYTDLNFIQQAGWGWHAGVQLTAKLPVGLALQIPVRLEYRRFAANYRPQYFSTFYEVERVSYVGLHAKNPDGSDRIPGPKAKEIRHLTGEGLNGYYGDLAFDFAGIAQVGAVYENYVGGDPNVQAFLAVPALDTLQFKAFYAKTGLKDFKDATTFDDRSMAVVQARYALVSYVYLVARVTRRWEMVAGKNPVEFAGKTDYDFGVEASLDF